MDQFASFRVFARVAETRSFVAAGRALGISASAVGKSISRLEDRLGVRLFHRSTRSIALTTEGQYLLERCRRIFAEVDDMEAELTATTSRPKGRLRISLPLVSSLVLPLLADFMLAYPDVQLDLDFSDRLVDVVEEGFDAVVRTGKPADSRLTARQVGSFRLRLVGSPRYFERAGTPHTPAELATHLCLHYRFPTSGRLELWPLRTEPGTPEPCIPISMVCNNIETRLCFAQRGVGIACLPDFAVGNALADGTLVTVLDDFMERTIPLNVLWPSSRHLTPRLRAFIDFFSERVTIADPACRKPAPEPSSIRSRAGRATRDTTRKA
ncbi:DNA-binding transcriptional LysR family regulator [Luteibacter sp. Sphag1AF]|uniref:LysR family transcriptional regulator n=1 Tax=Luteibacter sp. Sphag1AF TaxID=2587031 RepID=UPI001610AB7B|nr:LysR family transcriptional regulator [Luteibacter sp. Sphag1AF]MBB3226540.1 DNA-binding transcriptional LysR family regulator [Luteibacter sp. Sphag1AF]